ncbi:hypothetical protein A2U01_0078432, partial [Trifolium medium]|nr:hypothetical protein [Trifolium medium]
KDDELNIVKLDRAGAYLDGFDFAIAQVKVIYPEADHSLLEQADAFKVIKDGKLVDQEVPTNSGPSGAVAESNLVAEGNPDVAGEAKVADGNP